MSLKVMETLGIEERREFGQITCAACGKPVSLKANKKGLVYYFCAHVNAKGEWCNHHQKWGNSHSDKLMIAHKGAGRVTLPGTPDTGPEPEAKRETGGTYLDC